jgi:hemerythrin
MVEWTPDLLLNHETLDPQHADIFKRLAEVEARLDAPRAELERAVAALADSLVTHLAAEERIMEEALYPERTRHRSAHELFMADFDQFRRELGESGPTQVVTDWIRRRIPEWLRFHITVNDLPLGVYLSRRRARPPQPFARTPKDGGNRLS